ncbi:WD40 repeat-like protein [Coprinellus micaceus]|uniref:WD40 repeat-like protein n=1 Tax=Coprinellus micaceus TaxID=71717 RepID=A0A4Y7RRH9_COPMI|nr:WD40 repeat-like protein [Coprinellus micaceus]
MLKSPQSRSSSPNRVQESRPGGTPSGWHSCHIPSFTSAFGFSSSPGGSKPKRELESMETDEASDHANVQGTGLCVRHERLRADYKRLKQSETDHQREDSSASARANEPSEQDANLKEILSSFSSPNTHDDDQVVAEIQRTFDTFAQASHPTRTLILHGLLSTCCYSQLSLLRENLGESVSARPHLRSLLSSSQGPPCDTTPSLSSTSPSADPAQNSLETKTDTGSTMGAATKLDLARARSLVLLPSPARADPLLVLPLELSTRIFSYLDARDLCTAAQVCRKWKEVSEDNTLWKAVYERTFGSRARTPSAVANGTGTQTRSTGSMAAGETRSIPGEPAGSKGASGASGRARVKTKAEREGPDFFLVEGYRLRGGGVPSSPGGTASASTPHPFRRPPLHTRSSSWKLDFKSRLSTTLNWARGVPASTYTLPSTASSSAPVMCLQVDWEEGIVIAGSEDGYVRLWDLRSGSGRSQATNGAGPGTELRRLIGHTASVRALQFDNVKLITGSLDGSMKVWDWRTGRCVRTLTPGTSRNCGSCDDLQARRSSDGSYPVGGGERSHGGNDGVLCLQFDNDILVNGSMDGAVRVWDLKRACVDTLRGHGSSEVNAVKIWSSQSFPSELSQGEQEKKLVFSASADCTIKLWDVASKTCLRSFTWHLAPITSLVVVPALSAWSSGEVSASPGGGGPVIVSAGLDNSLGVWDLDMGKCVQALLGHTKGVTGTATDGVRVASASYDGTVMVWDGKGECVMRLEGSGGRVHCVQVNEEGIVCGMDGKVQRGSTL